MDSSYSGLRSDDAVDNLHMQYAGTFTNMYMDGLRVYMYTVYIHFSYFK